MAFQLVPEFTPGAPSGVCFTCKAARRPTDRVIDVDFDVELLNSRTYTEIDGMAFELATGDLNICETCVKEMARIVGMIDGKEFDTVQGEVLDALREVDERNKDITALEAQVSDLQGALRVSSSLLVDHD